MNAKKELLETLKHDYVIGKTVKHVRFTMTDGFSKKIKEFDGKLEDALEALDVTYDDGYGSQELFGNVWFTDGSWLDRDEYDGAESWELRECPAI